MKKYIVLGGVNGAGKSTLYQILDNLKKMPRVNTDEIVKELGDWRNTSDVLKAGKIAVQLIDKYFSEGISFNQESTLCGKSIIKNFKRAKQLGYTIELHYVGVDSVETAKRRVAERVQNGGHGIPESDIDTFNLFQICSIYLKNVIWQFFMTIVIAFIALLFFEGEK